jgi:hypothetical protein
MALDGSEWSTSYPSLFAPGERTLVSILSTLILCRRNKPHSLVSKQLSYPESHRNSSSQLNLIFMAFDSWKLEDVMEIQTNVSSPLPPLIMDRVNAM